MSLWWPTHTHCLEKMRFCSAAKTSSEIRYFCGKVLAPALEASALPVKSAAVVVFTRRFDNLDSRCNFRQASTNALPKPICIYLDAHDCRKSSWNHFSSEFWRGHRLPQTAHRRHRADQQRERRESSR